MRGHHLEDVVEVVPGIAVGVAAPEPGLLADGVGLDLERALEAGLEDLTKSVDGNPVAVACPVRTRREEGLRLGGDPAADEDGRRDETGRRRLSTQLHRAARCRLARPPDRM